MSLVVSPPGDHRYVYGKMPPDTVRSIEPLLNRGAVHVISVATGLVSNFCGSVRT